MKKLLFTVSLISSIFLIAACSEDEAAAVIPASTSGFVWVDNTGASVTADSAYYDSQYKTIKAFKGGLTKFVEINLTAGTVGTYTLGTTNAFSYLSGSSLYMAASGSVVITENANSKMTGSFTTTGTGASITSITGTFTNITVR